MFSRPLSCRSFGVTAAGLWWLVVLLCWPLASAAANACDATVLLIDANISDSDYARAMTDLKGGDPARQLGAVVFDSVVRQVVRPVAGNEAFAQIDTALASSRAIGADGRSNFAVAAERSLDLLGLAGNRKGSRCLLLLGEQQIDSGKPELNKQYRQWFDEVLMPRLTRLGVSFNGIAVAPAAVPQQVAADDVTALVVAPEAPSPAAEQRDASSPVDANLPSSDNKMPMLVGGLLLLVALAAAALFWLKRRSAAGDAVDPVEDEPVNEAPAPQPTVVRPVSEAVASADTPEKTQVRPAVVPTQINENLGDTAKRPAIRTDTTAVTEQEMPAVKGPSPDTTQQRPNDAGK